MTISLSAFAGVGTQFFDDSGNVLSGGKVYTYDAGTTTPRATYTDITGSVPHSNPIILDSAGRVPSGGMIWVTDGLLYKFVVTTSLDVTLDTYNNVSGISGSITGDSGTRDLVMMLVSNMNKVTSGFVLPASDPDLTMSIPSGSAIVAGLLVVKSSPENVVLTPSTTNHIFLQAVMDAGFNFLSANFVVNTSGAPPANSIKIGTAVTSGSAVTSTTTEPENFTIDRINGFSISATPAANTIPAHDASGNISLGVLSTAITQLGIGAVARDLRGKVNESIISVKDFGATGNGSTDDLLTIQAALDYAETVGATVFFPPGTYKITNRLYFGNGVGIQGVGIDSLIKGASLTVPLFQSRGGTTSRRYRMTMRDLGIDNTGKTAAGGIGIDLRNATDCKISNVFISNVDMGIQFFADAGLGCYYNTLTDVTISNANDGYFFSTLANENRMTMCRTNNVTNPLTLSDGSHNHIYSPAFEQFTTGINISGPASDTLIISPRLENIPSSGTGINIGATAVRTTLISPQYSTLTTNIVDASTTTFEFGWNGLKINGGTRATKHQSVKAALDIGSIAASSTVDTLVTISGALDTDSVFVTPPAALPAGLVCTGIPASGGVYIRLANVYGATAVDPALLTYTIDIWRH